MVIKILLSVIIVLLLFIILGINTVMNNQKFWGEENRDIFKYNPDKRSRR